MRPSVEHRLENQGCRLNAVDGYLGSSSYSVYILNSFLLESFALKPTATAVSSHVSPDWILSWNSSLHLPGSWWPRDPLHGDAISLFQSGLREAPLFYVRDTPSASGPRRTQLIET